MENLIVLIAGVALLFAVCEDTEDTIEKIKLYERS